MTSEDKMWHISNTLLRKIIRAIETNNKPLFEEYLNQAVKQSNDFNATLNTLRSIKI